MNKLNWPAAFVIVAIIFAGAFVYNKPTDAGLGSDAGMTKAVGQFSLFMISSLMGWRVSISEC